MPMQLSYCKITICKYIVKYFPYPKVANPVPQSGQYRTLKWPIPYPKVASLSPKWGIPYPKVANSVPQSGQSVPQSGHLATSK